MRTKRERYGMEVPVFQQLKNLFAKRAMEMIECSSWCSYFKIIMLLEIIASQVIKHLTNHEFLVSKETVVLCRWERSKQKFGFIKRVDKG